MTDLEAPAPSVPYVPSPFFEGTKLQRVWDSTSLRWLRTCPQLYDYVMIQGWRRPGMSHHLLFGQVYHSALEAFDRARVKGASREASIREAVKVAFVDSWQDGIPWGDDKKNRATLIRTVVWYFEAYPDDEKNLPLLVLPGNKPAVELHFLMPNLIQAQGVKFGISGHIDRMVRLDTAPGSPIAVVDRKTTKDTLGNYFFQKFNPDVQMSLYAVAAQKYFQTEAWHIIIDAAQVTASGSEFARGLTHRSPELLDEWLVGLEDTMISAVRFAEKDNWPLNDSGGSCRFCDFREICSLPKSIRQNFLEAAFVKSHWNPLSIRGEDLG